MRSASDKFLAILPARLGLGPHATRLVYEAQKAMHHKLWASAIILSATIIDVIRYEDQIYDLDEDPQGGEAHYDYEQSAGYFEASGYDYLTASDRRKLEWLREARNRLVHYEGPLDGMMGASDDERHLSQMADKAASALLLILEG